MTRGAADEKRIVEARWMRVEGFMVVERGDPDAGIFSCNREVCDGTLCSDGLAADIYVGWIEVFLYFDARSLKNDSPEGN